jgi:acyl-CoA thioesterase-1
MKVMPKFSDRRQRWLAPVLLLMVPLLISLAARGADPVFSHKIVFLGDSLAAGLGVDPDEAFPALIQKRIEAAGWKDTVVNAGVSGDTSADGLGRIDWLLKQRIDMLVLELGGNDGLRGLPVAATQTNLQAIIDRVKQKYPQAQIIVAGMQMPPNMGGDYTTAFRDLYPNLAAANHAALIPFLLAGVGGKPELNQPDHIHPNVEGHKIVADNVWKVLQPLLERVRRAEAQVACPKNHEAGKRLISLVLNSDFI